MDWVVQGWCEEYGWEDLTAEETREEGEQRLAEYDQHEPEVRHRLKGPVVPERPKY